MVSYYSKVDLLLYRERDKKKQVECIYKESANRVDKGYGSACLLRDDELCIAKMRDLWYRGFLFYFYRGVE